jgi:predicted transposase YdaD
MARLQVTSKEDISSEFKLLSTQKRIKRPDVSEGLLPPSSESLHHLKRSAMDMNNHENIEHQI